MGINKKARLAKEADYIKKNDDVKSVCSGVFYNRSKKKFEPCANCKKCFKFKEYNTLSEEEKRNRPEVGFHYIDSFRSCEYYKYKPVDEEFVIRSITYTTIYINDTACNYVKELEKYVKDSKDKELQKKYGAAIKRVNAYFKMIYNAPNVSDNIDFLAEFNGAMDDVSDNCKEKLEKAMLDFYTEAGVSNPELLSKVEMARTIVEYAVKTLDKMIFYGSKSDKNVVLLQTLRLTSLYSVMEDLSNWAFRHVRDDANMSKDQRIIDAYRDLNDKLINFDKISLCLYQAECSCNQEN